MVMMAAGWFGGQSNLGGVAFPFDVHLPRLCGRTLLESRVLGRRVPQIEFSCWDKVCGAGDWGGCVAGRNVLAVNHLASALLSREFDNVRLFVLL